MATIKQFEDLQVWRLAREFTQQVYRLTSTEPACRDFALRDQIRRSSISVMSNIAEGFGRGGNREFLNFLHIARGSLAEAKSQLYVMLDTGHINQDQFTTTVDRAIQTEACLNGLIKYLSKSNYRDAKFVDSELREPNEVPFILNDNLPANF